MTRAPLDEREAAMRRAGRSLARRARSEAELERSLSGVAPPAVVAGVLDDLRSLGYLDDTALACSLVERRLESGWGSLRVRADLERLAINGDAARAAIALAEAGEAAAAEHLLAGRAPRPEASRVASLLVRRGFGEETVDRLAPTDFE